MLKWRFNATIEYINFSLDIETTVYTCVDVPIYDCVSFLRSYEIPTYDYSIDMVSFVYLTSVT